MVTEIFQEAEKQGYASPGWEPFSKLIQEKTKKRIPSGSLKFWYYGHSEPRVSQLEAMASALGYELDILIERGTRKGH